MSGDRFHGLSAMEKLMLIEADMAAGVSASALDAIVHGLIAGEAGLTAEEAYPETLPECHREIWSRCHWRGAMCRRPETAKLPANPNHAAAQRPSPRRWEEEADLIGGGLE